MCRNAKLGHIILKYYFKIPTYKHIHNFISECGAKNDFYCIFNTFKMVSITDFNTPIAVKNINRK
jgi:hypothetical protein